MKITCERCRAQYDVDDAKIPASGFKMTCPACNNEIKVEKGAVPAAAPAGPREIELSSFEDEPAAASPSPSPSSATATAAPALALSDEAVDFAQLATAAPSQDPPESKGIALSSSGGASAADDADLPAPVRKPEAAAPPVAAKPSAASDDNADLPAPRRKAEPVRPPAAEGADLPAPKAPPPAKPPVPGVSLDAPKAPSKPASPPPPPVAEIPRPKAPPPRPAPPLPPVAAAPPPSPAPPPAEPAESDDIAIPLDLDAPDVDDEAPALGQLDDRAEDGIDLPAPRADGGIDLPAPRPDGSVDLPAPRVDASVDLPAPRPDGGVDVPAPRADSRPAAEASKPPTPAAPAPSPPDLDDDDDSARPRSRRKVFAIAGGGAGLLAAAAGVAFALGLIGPGGAARKELEVRLVTARRAIADDTLPALRKAAADLKSSSSAGHPNVEANAVEAQVRLLLARLGVGGELAAAKALLDSPVEGTPSPDRRRAEGLKALASGDVAGARKIFKELVAASPADAASLCDLGLVELHAHDPAAAAAVFAKASAAEPARAHAAYGLGLAKERQGDDAAATAAYTKAITAAPEHARARLGLLRIAARGGDSASVAKLNSFLSERNSSLAPREQAEALVAIGQAALAAGRLDDAEERFKKALSVDPEGSASLVAEDAKLGLARARIVAGHGGESVDDLRKIVAADLRGVDARLVLVEALLDKRELKDAETVLSAAEKLDGKNPQIPYLRGRLFLSRTNPSREDREQAVTRFREATAADPKLVPAWTAMARALHELGRTAEAAEALDKAAATLSTDARGAAALGAAYLAIGRPADAEARFRTVLAADGDKLGGPERLPVWLGLADALEAQDKLDAAEAAYADAEKIAPKSPVLLERRGRLAQRRGRIDEARALFDEALKSGTPTTSLRLAAAELAIKSGRLPDARALVEAVVKEDENSATANLALARIELASNRPSEALAYARRAVALRDLPEGHLLLGQAYEQSGKADAALAEYKLGQRGSASDAALLGYARILVRKGSTKDALVALAPLSKNASTKAEARLLEGDCYADLQQADNARHAYEEAAKLMPQSGEAAFKYGRAMIDAGRRKPGLDVLERAVKLGQAGDPWLADAYLLIGDAHRQGKEKDPAIRAYTKYLELAPATSPTRAEAKRQISLLGGTPPAGP